MFLLSVCEVRKMKVKTILSISSNYADFWGVFKHVTDYFSKVLSRNPFCCHHVVCMVGRGLQPSFLLVKYLSYPQVECIICIQLDDLIILYCVLVNV